MTDPSYCKALEEENEKLRKLLSEEQTVRDEMEGNCKFFRNGKIVDVACDSGWGVDESLEDQTITLVLEGKNILKHPAICDRVESYRISEEKYRELREERDKVREKIQLVLAWFAIILAVAGLTYFGVWVINWVLLFTP